MLFDLGLDRFPTTHAAVIEVFEADGFLGISHGDDLHIIELKEGSYVGTTLATTADDGDVDFIARRNRPGGAEDLTGQDGHGGNRGRCCGEKVSTGDGSRGGWRHMRNVS